MLEDHKRTGAYYQAVMQNRRQFEGKVVLDVGTGSGILAVFAAKAGARKVYAVEATPMAKFAQSLVEHNGVRQRFRPRYIHAVIASQARRMVLSILGCVSARVDCAASSCILKNVLHLPVRARSGTLQRHPMRVLVRPSIGLSDHLWQVARRLHNPP